MNYELYIKVNDVWVQLDMGSDKPAMNYQVNDIAELQSRQADYSQALKLPMTPTNRMHLGNSDQMDVVTDVPYKKHECRLYGNGYVIAGMGFYLIVNRITDFFEVQILSGVIGIFELLSRQPMRLAPIGSIVRNNTTANPANFTPEYVYGAATFIKGGAPVFQNSLEHFFPLVNLKKAIETILGDYTLTTNLADGDWEKLYLSLINMKSDFPEYNARGDNNGTVQPGGIEYTITEAGSGTLTKPAGYLEYRPTFDCTVNLRLNITASILVQVVVIRYTGGIPTDIYDKTLAIHDTTLNTPVAAGDYIQIIPIASATTDLQSYISFKVQPTFVQEGEILPFGYNIGFDTRGDLFKMFLQLFGLTAYADVENKIIYAYTMQKVYDNKSIAKDWSNKLHTDDPSDDTFTFGGYAQDNHIALLDNTDDGVNDFGSFTIDNELLVREKTLFTIPIQSGADNYVGDKLVANIPLEEITDTDILLKGCPPHIIELQDDTVTYDFGAGEYDYQLTKHLPMQHFVDTFYGGLKKMLTTARFIERRFNLTDQDIQDYNPFIPVYIAKYGHYFYINRISNYVSGQLTKVQLIKL